MSIAASRAMGMCKRCGIAFTAEVTSRENGMVNIDHFTPGWQDRQPPTIEQPAVTQE